MKTSLKLFGVILLCYLTFACSKKNQDSTHPNTMRATTTGGVYTYFREGNMPDANKTVVGGATQLTITASSNDQPPRTLTFVIKNYTGVAGTFNVVGVSGDAYAAYNTGVASSSDILSSNSASSPGVITITAVDASSYSGGKMISGTFNFVAGTYGFTAGTFNVYVPN